jgi:hypothetical protein
MFMSRAADAFRTESSPPSGIRRRAVIPCRPITLVIVESGSCWPEGFERSPTTHDCILIAQQLDESPEALAERVVRRLDSIRSKGAVIERATFAAGAAMGSACCNARSRVARALLASSTLAPCGSIDFVTHESASEEAKRELLALAGTLLEQIGPDAPAVNVRFAGTHESTSGVRRAVPRPDDGDALFLAG